MRVDTATLSIVSLFLLLPNLTHLVSYLKDRDLERPSKSQVISPITIISENRGVPVIILQCLFATASRVGWWALYRTEQSG
jgi:hypothetical protein